ncbi:MAG: hypothetical protein Q4G54_09380 [Pelistega sp.]|nr:hypothetical protein [Pelistega sp.]
MRNFVYPLIITLLSVFALAACDKPNTTAALDKAMNVMPATTGITNG